MNPRHAYHGDVEVARFLTTLMVVIIITGVLALLNMPKPIIVLPFCVFVAYLLWLIRLSLKRFFGHWAWLLKGAPEEEELE